jgi:hypothetical protein
MVIGKILDTWLIYHRELHYNNTIAKQNKN